MYLKYTIKINHWVNNLSRLTLNEGLTAFKLKDSIVCFGQMITWCQNLKVMKEWQHSNYV